MKETIEIIKQEKSDILNKFINKDKEIEEIKQKYIDKMNQFNKESDEYEEYYKKILLIREDIVKANCYFLTEQ